MFEVQLPTNRAAILALAQNALNGLICADGYYENLRAGCVRDLVLEIKQERHESILLSTLTVLTWYEAELRGEKEYRPRGFEAVAAAWQRWLS